MTKFEKQCNEVSEKLNVDVIIWNKETSQEPFEDDGNLNITKRGIRACFDVGCGQSLGGKEQNERTLAVLNALGITKFANDRVLVEEHDDDCDDECPHCGQPV